MLVSHCLQPLLPEAAVIITGLFEELFPTQ